MGELGVYTVIWEAPEVLCKVSHTLLTEMGTEVELYG